MTWHFPICENTICSIIHPSKFIVLSICNLYCYKTCFELYSLVQRGANPQNNITNSNLFWVYLEYNIEYY
jgi:hypothetical protein